MTANDQGRMVKGKPIRSKETAAALLLALVALSALLLAVHRYTRVEPLTSLSRDEISQCDRDTGAALSINRGDLVSLDRLSTHCIQIVRNLRIIEDFEVRRQAFLQQYQRGEIILWLVISITVSGIVMAAVQLVAAYNLSIAFGQVVTNDSELTFDAKGMTIRSTVSGLVILAMSFAFFLVYVVDVYPVAITNSVQLPPMEALPDAAQNQSAQTSVHQSQNSGQLFDTAAKLGIASVNNRAPSSQVVPQKNGGRIPATTTIIGSHKGQ